MDRLPFRQIHLDFHTGDPMPDVGADFTEENFKEALRVGHVNSITLFAKCHHGWSYYPSKVAHPHPALKTDLLGRELAVCRELGVRTQIYISAGLDEYMAYARPQYRTVNHGQENSLLGAHFHQICLNNDEYLSYLCAQVNEVMEMYGDLTDGIFMDICTPSPCFCSACINSMVAQGLNPENDADLFLHARRVYDKYTEAVNKTVAAVNPAMPVFHNCGNLPRNDRDWAFKNTAHLELESLPTGGWGYDHFPMSAAYCRVLGREFTGMTGKFHKTWGEFGGYKHPNALRYESALSLALGAKCSVGDQLHPLGKFDIPTYELIGKAYAEVEQKEAWCHDVTAVTDVAIFTTYGGPYSPYGGSNSDTGANRILLEGKYLYNIIDRECAFEDYKVIIFPDIALFDNELSERVNKYLDNGGRILLSGQSGLKDGQFFRDFGVKMEGENPYDNTYLVPRYDMKGNGIASYLMYRRGYAITAGDDVKVMADMQNSYFNRSLRHFCSHSTTPNDPASHRPGCVISGDGSIGYIAWNIFDEYSTNGSFHHKQIVCDMLDILLGDGKTLTTSLPSNGVVTLMYQPSENRYVNHVLYAVTKMRGSVEVIEDAIPIRGTKVSVRLPGAPVIRRVYSAPDGTDIPYTYENGVLSYTVPEFVFHGMIVIDI